MILWVLEKKHASKASQDLEKQATHQCRDKCKQWRCKYDHNS